MNQNVKNVLGGVAIVCILVGAYAVVSYVQTYARSIQPGAYRSFGVSAEGKVVAVPDVAEFSFSVITQGGTDVGKLQAQNSEKSNKAVEFIKAQGVDAKDIKTQGYSVDPRYQYFDCSSGILVPNGAARPCPPPEIVGYTVTQTVSVKVRDFAKAGDILSGTVGAGANSVSQLSFTIDDPTVLEQQAREEAIAKAKAKAQAIAQAGGFSLGELLAIEEGAMGPYYYDKAVAFGRGGGGSEAAAAPPVEPGSQDVIVSVTLRYEIQ